MKWARALRYALFLGCAQSLTLPVGVGRCLDVGGEAAASASEPLIIQVRGRSQLRLHEEARAPTTSGRFRLSLRLELHDGQAHAGFDEAAGSAPDHDGTDGINSANGINDPARSFANQSVVLAVHGPQGPLPPQTVTTDPSGHKLIPLGELEVGRYTVTASYAGDAERDPAQTSLIVDLGKQPTLLAIEVPEQAAHTGELTVKLSLFSERIGLTGQVQLLVGETSRFVLVRRGLGESRVPLLGQRWAHKGQSVAIIASYRGDPQHGSALQRRDVLCTSQARVTIETATAAGHSPTLAGSPLELAQGSAFAVTGRASDEDGPLADEPIDVELSEQPSAEPTLAAETAPPGTIPPRHLDEAPRTGRAIASGVTDPQGRFHIVVPRLTLHPGPAVLGAQVTPRYHYILPGRAAELPITILPPEPVSALYYVLPLVFTGLCGLLWALGRWLQPLVVRLLAALRERRKQRAAASPSAVQNQSSAGSSAAEVVTGEPGVRLTQSRRLPGLTLRRTVDNTLDGQVLDASFGRPVSGAILTLQAAAGTATFEAAAAAVHTAAEDGRFAIAQLAAGRYLVTVTAPGYLPQSFTAAFPHRGELRGVSVNLEPIRVRLLGQWRRVALRLLGQEARLQTATPRELLEQFGRLRAAQGTARELVKLTELVEQAYYSRRVCTPELLAEATRLCDVVLQSRLATGVPLIAPPTRNPGSPMPLS